MGTLSEREPTSCNPGAVVSTMGLGVAFGVLSSILLAVGAHVLNAIANPGVASPSIEFELILTSFIGLLFSLAAAVGAAVALGLTDHRLHYSRFVQGGIAAFGAVISGLGIFVFLGQTATLQPVGVAGVLSFVAVAAFGLMCARAKAHTSPLPRGRALRVKGIKL